jgi:hypothetical protein
LGHTYTSRGCHIQIVAKITRGTAAIGCAAFVDLHVTREAARCVAARSRTAAAAGIDSTLVNVSL